MMPATAPVIPESALAHHVALGALLVNVFPISPDGRHYLDDEAIYSLTFTSSILQIITREVLQASFQALLSQTDPLLQTETKRVARSSRRLRERGEAQLQHVEAFEVFSSWLGHFVGLPIQPNKSAHPSLQHSPTLVQAVNTYAKLFRLFAEEDENGDLPITPIPRPLDHSSLLGIFARSLLLTLRKLSFYESVALTKLVAQWCGTEGVPGPSRPTSAGIYSLNRKTAMDDTLDKRKAAMERYKAAAASGDYTKALHALKQFYDYDFPSNLRSQHQHALLGLATFHHATGGPESARLLADEAIRVARAESDKQCLQRCLSLIQRLDIESGPPISDLRSLKIVQGPVSSVQLPPATSAMDELWAIKAAMDLGEPAHIALERTHRALAMHEASVNPTDERPPGKDVLDFSTWHATQAGLWNLMGSETLARLHEDLAVNRPSNKDARLTVTLSRAVRAADRAAYDEALGMLLDSTLLQDMTIQEYGRWTDVLWAVLDRQISFSGDTEGLTILRRLQGSPSGGGNSDRGGQNGSNSVIEALRDALRKAKKLSEVNTPAHLVLPGLLSCTELSASLGLWPIYRLSVVIAGYVFLSLEVSGMAQKAIDQVMEVWPQILASSDQEAKALGALVLGKAKVDLALDGQSQHLLDEAKADLHMALRASRALGSQNLVVQCTSLLSLIGQVTGSTAERDDMSVAWQQAQEGDAAELAKRRDQLKQIGEIVKLVGVRISSGSGVTQ